MSTSFKQGIVIPVHKGKGRDPLLTKSYYLAKMFEIVPKSELDPFLMNTTFLIIHRPGISFRNSIFAGLEAEKKSVDESDRVYTMQFL